MWRKRQIIELMNEPVREKIAIFLAHPKCSIQSVNGVIHALSSHYDFKVFTKHELEEGFLDDVDLVVFPGGFGDSDSYDILMKQHTDIIRQFVERGGKYLGICMGAYWADRYYFDILKGIEVVQYIKQPGAAARRPHAKNMSITWQDQPMHMFFYDGCTFKGENLNVYASYASGHPMAIIQGNIGLIGCHPESQSYWYKAYSWMRGKYHQGKHHQLLLEFVHTLMKPQIFKIDE